MSQPLTPLDAVKNNESYQDLIHSIGVKLQCGETEIDFDDDHDLDLATLGRDFSAVELSVALNEYRTQGWQIEKIKRNIYQFTAAPVATVTSVAPMHKVVPLSPEAYSERTDAEMVDSIVAIINLQLGSKRKNDRMITIYREPFLSSYDSDTLNLAIKKFEEVGWSVGESPTNDWYFQKL